MEPALKGATRPTPCPLLRGGDRRCYACRLRNYAAHEQRASSIPWPSVSVLVCGSTSDRDHVARHNQRRIGESPPYRTLFLQAELNNRWSLAHYYSEGVLRALADMLTGRLDDIRLPAHGSRAVTENESLR